MAVPRRLISLIPDLMGGEGHIIPYHRAVGQVVANLGWEYQAWVPQGPGLEALPEGWQACLSSVALEREGHLLDKLGRIPLAIALGQSIARAIKAPTTAEKTIIFLERFIHLQLLALVLAVWLLPQSQRAGLSLWILYRRDVHRDKTRFFYKYLHSWLFRAIGPQNCQFFTDSEPLQRSLIEYFQVPVTVLPIPHTEFAEVEPMSAAPCPMICWWPGSPRPEKGWTIIQQLSQARAAVNHRFCLVAAQSSELVATAEGVSLHLVGDRLTREDYAHWLARSRIILLPYDPVAYQERTSGIFTEAIIAGRLPVVTAHTWMAQELLRFDLGDLILDWQEPDLVWPALAAIATNAEIQARLQTMQAHYRDFHSLGHYQRLFQTSAQTESLSLV